MICTAATYIWTHMTVQKILLPYIDPFHQGFLYQVEFLEVKAKLTFLTYRLISTSWMTRPEISRQGFSSFVANCFAKNEEKLCPEIYRLVVRKVLMDP